MKLIRVFIAVPVSPDIIEACQVCIDSMPGPSRAVRWVSAGSIHLTLKFLGEIPSSRLGEITDATGAATAAHQAFTVATTVPGAFPNWRQPRVLWIGLDAAGTEPLRELQRSVDQHLHAAGFAPEKRRYSPHLTLGRVKQPDRLGEIAGAFRDYAFPSINMGVDSVHIMQSELRPTGAVYSVLESFKLAGCPPDESKKI